MHDQRAQRQLLLAAFGTGARDAFEAFEQAIEPLRADAACIRERATGGRPPSHCFQPKVPFESNPHAAEFLL
jgi:hypothetical protein